MRQKQNISGGHIDVTEGQTELEKKKGRTVTGDHRKPNNITEFG